MTTNKEHWITPILDGPNVEAIATAWAHSTDKTWHTPLVFATPEGPIEIASVQKVWWLGRQSKYIGLTGRTNDGHFVHIEEFDVKGRRGRMVINPIH